MELFSLRRYDTTIALSHSTESYAALFVVKFFEPIEATKLFVEWGCVMVV